MPQISKYATVNNFYNFFHLVLTKFIASHSHSGNALEKEKIIVFVCIDRSLVPNLLVAG